MNVSANGEISRHDVYDSGKREMINDRSTHHQIWCGVVVKLNSLFFSMNVEHPFRFQLNPCNLSNFSFQTNYNIPLTNFSFTD